MFWLSHHPPEELNRTYRVGGVHVCARCLGTYPTLVAGLVVQFSQRAPLAWAYDLGWTAGLLLPALADWAYGRFHPHRGTNLWRTATGVLLGAALARSLYVHFQRPFPLTLLVQAALVTAVGVPVILLARGRAEDR